MLKIDELDQKILEVITIDARVPYTEIADTCKVSRAAVHQRVQRLLEKNVLRGSAFIADPKALGYTTCTYVGITLERGSMYKQVANELETIPEIVECHFTTGSYTMLVKLFCHNNEHLMELLNRRIQKIDGVTSTETLISLEQTFARPVPILPSADLKKHRARGRRKRSEMEAEDWQYPLWQNLLTASLFKG